MTAGVLLMAHGTPASAQRDRPLLPRIRRGRPPEPAQLAELVGRYEAIGGVSPLAVRTAAQVEAVRATLGLRRPGRYVVAFGAKHTDPLIEESAAMLGGAGLERVIGLVLTPHGSSLGSQEYLDRAAAALRRHALRAGRTVVRRAVAGRPPHRPRAGCPSRSPGRARVIFTAHSLPERIRQSGDTYPARLAASARLVGDGVGRAPGRAPGARPNRGSGPDVRDVVRRLGADATTDRGGGPCPIGFVADHLEVLYDLDVELAGVAAAVRARLYTHGIAQRRRCVHRRAGRRHHRRRRGALTWCHGAWWSWAAASVA